jgi:predicted metal-dependent enzyme (double-stranded beta helix superfamily)
VQILASEPSLEVRPDIDPTLPLPPRLLSALAFKHAGVARFEDVAEPQSGERTSARVFHNATHDVWLIRWGPGARTELHDHGDSAGAICVVAGELVENRPNPAGVGKPLRRVLRELDDRPMAPSHVHEVANESDTVAASVHVYSPPLATMRHFDLANGSELRMIGRELIDTPESAFV